jgi:hypothetical protein
MNMTKENIEIINVGVLCGLIWARIVLFFFIYILFKYIDN